MGNGNCLKILITALLKAIGDGCEDAAQRIEAPAGTVVDEAT